MKKYKDPECYMKLMKAARIAFGNRRAGLDIDIRSYEIIIKAWEDGILSKEETARMGRIYLLSLIAFLKTLLYDLRGAAGIIDKEKNNKTPKNQKQ